MASSICRRVALALALAVLSIAGPVRAQPARPDDDARTAARAKLVEGVDALRRGEHRLALEKFQEAYALVPSAKIFYDFGLAYVALGRRAEALAAFERFLGEAHDAPADKRQRAAEQIIVLRSQVGTAAITVPGAPDGTTIVVDGRDLGRVPLARPVYLDPGRHEIAARSAAGRAGPVQQIDIRAGAGVEVVVPVEGAGPTVAVALPATRNPDLSARPPAGPGPVEPAPMVAAGDGLGGRRIAALSIGAGGVALIGAGLTFGVLAKREGDSLSRDSANGEPPLPPTPFDADKESRGLRYQTLEAISLVAGAVGLAAGIVLYATTRGRVTVEPGASRTLAGTSVHVWF